MNKYVFLHLFFFSFFFLHAHAQKADIVFYNANVVDVEQGKIIPRMTVSVKDGKIVKIAKAAKKIKKNERDLTGKYLMPGLIDSHVHFGISMMGNNVNRVIGNYLADGITTARDAGGDVPRSYKSQLDNGEIVGPTFYGCSFWVGARYTPRREDTPWNRTITDSLSTADLERYVIEAKEAGCTGLKLYEGLSARLLNRIVPLCLKHGVKPWGHAEIGPATAMDVVKAGVQTVSHSYLLVGIRNTFDRTYKDRMFSPVEVARRDSLYKEMLSRGTILDATVAISKHYAATFPVTREAYKAGVKIVAGTDLLGIFRQELRLLADSCGMSIPDVLRAATVNGAEVIGQEGKLGIIREGAEADLLVLTSTPLESLEALWQRQALYINGKEIKDQE
jgi:imidazolonepropionase-like amidohydrolase